jgi:putative peptidoglycan lipid II flippase
MDEREIAVGAPQPLTNHRRVLISMLLLGMTTLVAKLIALLRDLFVARQLGVGDDLDAYLVAMILPSYAVVVLAHAFGSGFLPTYVRVWQRDGLAAAQRLAGAILSLAILILIAVTLTVSLATPFLLPLVGLGFPPAKLALAWQLSFLVVGMIVASGVSAVIAAILNAHERFFPVAIAPALIPLGTLVLFVIWAERAGVYALAAGTLLGFGLEALLLLLAAWALRLLPRLQLGWKEPNVGAVGRQYLPVLLAGMLMSSSIVIDQAMAASLGSGDVSVLNYGGKVVAVVIAVVAVSMSTVLFPRFAHLIAAGQLREFMRTFTLYASGIVVLSIPGIAILEVLSEPLVRLLFERGEFTSEATVEVSRVQMWLLLQIPFYVVVMLGARVLSALDANASVLRISALNVGINVLANYLLMRQFGVTGIAMATPLVFLVAMLATLLAIRARIHEKG